MTNPGSNPSGLKFLFTEHDGRLFRPTRCWIKPEKGGLDSWSLTLTPPVGSDGPVVTDLKAWLLFGDRDKRFFQFVDPSEQRPMRGYQRQEVLKRYIRAVVQTLPERNQEGPFWLLMPSIADEERRKRYLETLEAALPGALILPEPEMVIEYFRLVKRELVLERDRTGIFLVVDVGASTCNLTFVLTTKSGKVVESTDGRQRTARLRAARGDAARFAGRWLDDEIASLLDIDLQQLDRGVRDDVLSSVERAKILVAESGEDAVIEHPMLPSRPILNREHLEMLADELWIQLTNTYDELASKLLAQLQGTDYAREQFAPLLEEHHVSKPGDVKRIIDTVLLAGGTSLLPGFERAMKANIFAGIESPRVLHVGGEYAVAAAVGAVAHVLHQHYDPSRLRGPKAEKPNLAVGEFLGTLPTDIYLGWKPSGAERAEHTRVLGRYEPFAEQGGERTIDGLPAYEAGTVLSARLLPGRDDPQVNRIGLKPKELRVNRAPGEMKLVWNPRDQEARMSSNEVTGTGGLFINLRRLRSSAPPPESRDEGHDGVMSDGAPDVVIDVGMSKTVVVVAEQGSISPAQMVAPPLFALPTHVGGSRSELPISATVPDTVESHEPTTPIIGVLPAGDLATSEHQTETPSSTSNARSLDLNDPRPDGRPENTNAFQLATAPPEGRPENAGAFQLATESRNVGGFADRLDHALSETRILGVKDVRSDLVMLLLALAVRPFVMLAGPPGSGKSSLVRIAASLLGATSDSQYCEVAVQPHWQAESDLPEAARTPLVAGENSLRLFLFDEFNLARPERYLMPFFRELEAANGDPHRARILACATLNIDDSSRPPSPKIMDRCFMIELDAPSATTHTGIALHPSKIEVGHIGPLPILSLASDTPRPRAWGPIGDLLQVIQDCVKSRNLRHDLLPSRRGLIDMEGILSLHEHAGVSSALLSEDELIDRVVAGRVLAKISGAAEQVEALVDALRRHLEQSPYPRCKRRLDLAQSQLQLGFVSPWQ